MSKGPIDKKMIETAALTKRYRNTLAVDNLDLFIPAGEIYGLLGPNGAGKTTTMRMLTTLTSPSSGEAWIDGVPVTDSDTVRERIGYLPESPPLYHELTAQEQLTHAAGLRDLPPTQSRERIETLLDQFGMGADAERPIVEYSKGMKQKVAFIQAILHDPAVVVLDEPTSGLDPQSSHTLQTMIADLANNGTTIILSTHILTVADSLADTIGVLFDGELVAEAAPTDLKDDVNENEGGTLEEAFLAITSETSTE